MATLTPTEKALQDFVCVTSGLDDTHVIFADGKPRPEGTYITLIIDAENEPACDEDHAERNPLVLAPDDVEAVNGNALTLTAHAYVNADSGLRFTTTGVLPAPLLTGVDYALIVDDANTVRVAATRTDALAGTPIVLLDAGTGTMSINTTATSLRVGQEIKIGTVGQRACQCQIQAYSVEPTGAGSARAVLKKLVDRAWLATPQKILEAAGIGASDFDTVQMIPGITNRDMYQGRAVTTFSFFVVAAEFEYGTTIEQAAITNTRGRTYIVKRI